MSVVTPGRKCDYCGERIREAKDYWRAERNSNGCRHPSLTWDFCSLKCLGKWIAERPDGEAERESD